MTDSAHIFIPEDHSLEAKIHAYKTMRNELHNIETSLKLSQDKDWKDRLGSQDELKQAHNIIKNSHRATLNNIRDIDLEQAQQKGLMSQKEVVEFSAAKSGFENLTDSKQSRIERSKAEIRKVRASFKKSFSRDNDLER